MNLSQKLRYKQRQSITEVLKSLRPIRSLREVAAIIGCTKANVWLIERQALYKVIKRMRRGLNLA